MPETPIPYYIFEGQGLHFPKALCRQIVETIENLIKNKIPHIGNNMRYFPDESIKWNYPRHYATLLNINWDRLSHMISSYLHAKSSLRRHLDNEKSLANYNLREPNKIYVYGWSFSKCCSECTQNVRGKVFLAEDVINQKNGITLLPLVECDYEGWCRCMWMKITVKSSYLDNDYKSQGKENNHTEWKEWIDKNSIDIVEPKSYLPELTKKEKNSIRVSVLKNKIRFNLGDELVSPSEDDYIAFAKDMSNTVPFLTEETKTRIMNGKESIVGKGMLINSFQGMLRRYNYCREKNLSCEELFGFSVRKSGVFRKEYSFELLDSYSSKNSFNRLRYFDPATANWLKDSKFIEYQATPKAEETQESAYATQKEKITYKHGFEIGDYCFLKNLSIERYERVIAVSENTLTVDSGYDTQKIYRIEDLGKISKEEAKRIIKLRIDYASRHSR